ncbi:MAG: cation transporter [Bradyrhizobium sp.]|nr:cation transporter [Bradyrhizobium sp.]
MAHAHEHLLGRSHSAGPFHTRSPENFDSAFAIGAVVNIGIVVAELVFGYLAHSLALVADAAHNMTDVAGLLLAWGAAWLSRRNPTAERTYGYRRASILAALTNAALLLVATGAIAVEAIRRLADPQPFEAGTVIWVAALAIVLNGAVALMFMRGSRDDLNIKGAFLHMLGDAAVSFGVVIAALVTIWTGWFWMDPAISLAIAIVVLLAGWSLARSSVNMALDAVPENVNREKVEAYLNGLPGVTEVHDLHIWAMSTTETALTAHLVRPSAAIDDSFIAAACEQLDREFKIHHATLQIEHSREACRLASDQVV